MVKDEELPQVPTTDELINRLCVELDWALTEIIENHLDELTRIRAEASLSVLRILRKRVSIN